MTTLLTTINELSASWGPLLWKAGWQGGLALLLALVLSRTLRKLPAQVHCWLWRLAYLKLLLAGLWLVPVELPWLPPTTSTPTAPAASAPVSLEPMEPTAIDLPRMAPLSAEVLVPSVTRPASAPQRTAASWLLLAWMAGVTILIARLLRQWLQIRSSTSHLTILTDETVQHALAEHCRRLGIARPPELRVTQDSCGPFLVGVFRPVIVLPQVVLQSCSDTERDAALLHELAHVRRSDLLWNWLPALAEAVSFFHPLVWLARREWRLSQEIAADQLAIASSPVSVTKYADSLVEMLAKCPTAANPPHLAISMSPAFSQLKRRMIAMQTFQPLTPTRRHALAAFVLAIAVLGIVPWKLVAQESPAGATPAAVQSEESVRTLTIHAVDDQGRSVEGASVVLPIHIGSGGTSRDVVSGITDAEGTVRLDVPDSWFEPSVQTLLTTVWAYKAGWALGTVHVGSQLTDGAAEDPIEVSLPRQSNPSFRILDEFGKPAANVIVEPQHYRSMLGLEYVPEELLQDLTTRVDAHGKVTILAIEKGKLHRLRIQSEEYGTQVFRVSAMPDGGDLRLRMARPLKGRVIATDPEWVRNIPLYFATGPQGRRGRSDVEGYAEAMTDADGRFEIRNIATGSLRIHEIINPDLPVRMHFPAGMAHTSEKEHILRLVPATEVSGKVIRKTSGEPIAGVKVSIRYGDYHQLEHTFTNEKGEFKGRVLPGEIYQRVMGIPDPDLVEIGSPWNERLDVPSSGEVFQLPTIELVDTYDVQGQLVDADGEGLADHRVWGVEANRRYGFATTNERGEFVMKLPVGLVMDKYGYSTPDGELGEAPILVLAPLKLRVLLPR